MKFLIQTINNKIKHDFSFGLIEAIEYNNWLNNNKSIKYKTTNLIEPKILKNYTPIGTVEFVLFYIWRAHNISISPINIPVELLSYEYTKRKVYNDYITSDIEILRPVFFKSNTYFKKFARIVSPNENIPTDNYQISEIIDIESEWRCFIYKKELVGIENYSGDFVLFPDINQVNKMIKSYTKSPIAYTLDIGVNKTNETFIIEVHDFFSCGLYGFNNYKILPYMFYNWYKEKVNTRTIL